MSDELIEEARGLIVDYLIPTNHAQAAAVMQMLVEKIESLEAERDKLRRSKANLFSGARMDIKEREKHIERLQRELEECKAELTKAREGS